MGAKGHAIGRLIVSTVFLGTLAALVLGIAGCDDRMARMEENQIRLQAMVAANARQLATVSSQIYVNNNEVQESIGKLDRNDQDLATGISTVQNEQGTLREAVTKGNQAIDKRMVALDENQRRLQDGVGQVAGVTQRTAADVTAIAREHATLHQMVQSSRKELGESIAAVAANGEKIRTDIGQLQQADQSMTERLVALAASQDRIYNGLDGLNKFMQAVANDVTGLAQGQAALRQAVNEHTVAFTEKSAVLEQNQRNMQATADEIAGRTKKNTEGIAVLTADQTALQRTLSDNHKIVTGQVAAVIENQQNLQAGINGLSEKTGQTAAQLAALTNGQDAIRETLNNDTGTVTAKLVGLSESQTGLQSNLSGLHQKADTIAGTVGAVRAEQAGLQETLKANHEATRGQVAQLSNGQQQLQGQLDVLTATAGQTALDVIALNDSNVTLQRTIQASTRSVGEKADQTAAGLISVADGQRAMQQKIDAGNKALADQAARLVGTQQTIQGQLDVLTATAGQTALDIMALNDGNVTLQRTIQTSAGGLSEKTDRIAAGLTSVADRQTAIQQKIDAGSKALADQTARLTGTQEALEGQLDVLTGMASQTALDVIGMAAGQDALTQNLQSHDQVIGSRIADLATGQQQTQSGLDTVLATAGQTALDVMDLNEGQTKLAQAVKADRQELVARLSEIVQSQQQWAQRLDAAQAHGQAVTATIAALEQHLTKLQGSLQPSLDGLNSQLGASGQSRAQFEAKVNQDIQAIAEAVAQLRQDQVSLTDQIEQIQKRTQSQTKDIITAIQQLRQPPAEVKVSDAAATVSEPTAKVSDSGTKLESSVAEAEAK
jgi:chromosome segregation ATPase